MRMKKILLLQMRKRKMSEFNMFVMIYLPSVCIVSVLITYQIIYFTNILFNIDK